MSLRLKIILSLLLLATIATAAVGVTSYLSTKAELDQVVNRSLDEAVRLLNRGDLPLGQPGNGGPPGGGPRNFQQVIVQVIDADGTIVRAPGTGEMPVGAADLRVASGADRGQPSRHDIEVDGESFRVLTVRASFLDGRVGAVQFFRSLRENQQSLDAILRHTFVGVGIVVVAAAIIGWLIGRQVTRRLIHLTDAAGEVASTGRLDVEVPTSGADEAGKLGRAFSGMLGALARSKQEQHQLVQDAGHELRTPLTSLRTNVSVLRQFDSFTPEQREQIIADLDSESRELTSLVNELVELATDRRDSEPVQAVDLGAIAERAAERTRRRSGREVVVHRDGGAAVGRPTALERALQNLIDNAAKFAPDGAVEVEVRSTPAGTTVSVRDHGPGLKPDDIPHVFDRFFRAVEARSLPGSGLGLSIVKSVVDAHGGTVVAGNAPDGGAIIGFSLPAPPPEPS